MKARIISEEEAKRILNCFLQHPDRVNTGATSDDMLKVIRWAEELKLNMLLNKTILKELYNGNLLLDLNEMDEVVMATKPTVNIPDPKVDEFLYGDLDDYLMGDKDGN